MSTSTRSVVVFDALPGRVGDYVEWVRRNDAGLGDHGLSERSVLVSGSRIIIHAAGPDSARVFEPERGALSHGPLVGILDVAEDGPAIFEEMSCWQTPEERPETQRAGLVLRLKEDRASAYFQWMAEALPAMESIWRRSRIWRHDVFQAGTAIVAYYECEHRYNVLKAFREPESLAMLMNDMANLVVLDPYVPMPLYEEVHYWQVR